ncbi:uncharacterized protein G2W53_013856 [Senna tora]|uniref:Uncharacterized protein n=1 Tax=Senna tora TaxID=362788 RepID=A0A834TZD3_9FABA|nr:uncharacterized protein G2W53_013856 [Senna tora]
MTIAKLPKERNRVSLEINLHELGGTAAQFFEAFPQTHQRHKVFNSRKALGGHLRVHKNLIWKTPNYLGRNNSIDGNHHENDNKFAMSSNLSYGTNRNTSSRAFPLGRPMYMGYPNNHLGLLPYRGSIGFRNSNAEAVRSFVRRFPTLSRNLLLKKYHNQNSHTYAPRVLCSACRYKMNTFSEFKDFNPHPGLEVSKLLNMKRPGFANLLPPQEAKFGGSSFYRDDNIKGETSASVRKRFFCEAPTNAVEARAPKRPMLRSLSHVGWKRNLPAIELDLFKDTNNSIPGTDGKEKVDEANMDISLHL